VWLMLEWIVVALFSCLALAWAYIYFSPTLRSNFKQRIDWPPEVTPEISPSNPPASSHDNAALPRIAIVCPGRNEANWITSTVPEMCSQDYPDYRVVYIDDHSDDATPAIMAKLAAKYPHLISVRNEIEPPPGWVGKCWAVQTGVSALRDYEQRTGWHADFVCFTDADIHWETPCLRGSVEHQLQHNADVVSVFPQLEFGFVAERLAILIMVVALGVFFPFQKAMDPKHPSTVTAGAFMLVRRKLYESIGGHEAVKGQLVEDINLGRALKAAGGRIRIGATKTLLRCRMYEDFADLWEGLTKNAFAGMENRHDFLLLLTVATILSNILGSFYPLLVLPWVITSHSPASWTALTLACAILLMQIRMMNAVRKAIGLPWPYALGLMPGSTLYLTIVWASVYRHHFGGNVWKGRAFKMSDG
jgi:Glycosyl transferase family 2